MQLLAMFDRQFVLLNAPDSPEDDVPIHATLLVRKIQIPNVNDVCGEIPQVMKPNLDVSDSEWGEKKLNC